MFVLFVALWLLTMKLFSSCPFLCSVWWILSSIMIAFLGRRAGCFAFLWSVACVLFSHGLFAHPLGVIDRL